RFVQLRKNRIGIRLGRAACPASVRQRLARAGCRRSAELGWECVDRLLAHRARFTLDEARAELGMGMLAVRLVDHGLGVGGGLLRGDELIACFGGADDETRMYLGAGNDP